MPFQNLEERKDPFCRPSVATFIVNFVAHRSATYGIRAAIMDPTKSVADVREIITENFIAFMFTAV